jgi:hypothetical protein
MFLIMDPPAVNSTNKIEFKAQRNTKRSRYDGEVWTAHLLYSKTMGREGGKKKRQFFP